MKTYVFTHVKGGVAKSTTTLNMGYALAMLGYKTLVIDADPQANTTFTLTGRLDDQKQGTLYEIFVRENPKTLREIVKPVEQQENLWIAESSLWMYRIERELASTPNREYILKKALRSIRGDFDYVLIDTNPSLGNMTLNGWYAADALVIPISLTTYGMVGVRLLEHELADIKFYSDDDQGLKIFGVVGTLDDHTIQSGKMLKRIKEHFGDLLFDTVIPRNIKAEEANNRAVSLFKYAATSTSAKAYAGLVKEFLAREEHE